MSQGYPISSVSQGHHQSQWWWGSTVCCGSESSVWCVSFFSLNRPKKNPALVKSVGEWNSKLGFFIHYLYFVHPWRIAENFHQHHRVALVIRGESKNMLNWKGETEQIPKPWRKTKTLDGEKVIFAGRILWLWFCDVRWWRKPCWITSGTWRGRWRTWGWKKKLLNGSKKKLISSLFPLIYVVRYIIQIK